MLHHLGRESLYLHNVALIRRFRLVSRIIVQSHAVVTGRLRRKLDEVLEHECQRVQRTRAPLSVIIIDADHFKIVNDAYGHRTGDQVLLGVAQNLQQNVRAVDTVGRWGGEEFMILCPETNLAGACALADSICATMECHDLPGVGSKTAPLGVAQYRAG